MTKSIGCERLSVSQNRTTSTKPVCSGHQRSRVWLLKGVFGLAATILIGILLLTSAFAQEQPKRAYSEYTFWYGGAFGNGHAFSNTINARNYQFESRYERLIYWSEPFAVRWVFNLTSALVGDPRTGGGHRVYSHGIGGSPIGAQVNFVHFRHIEPFLTSGGGFLYFNHRMFQQTRFNFTAQLGGGVQFLTSSRRTALDLGYKYHHISNANLGDRNPGLDSHMLFVGVSLLR